MAAFLNFSAAAAALALGMRLHRRTVAAAPREPDTIVRTWRSLIGPASVALAFSSMAAMGMEIVWFRHFTLLLGPLRSVYAMLLAIILCGIALGSLTGGRLHRWANRPAEWFIAMRLFRGGDVMGPQPAKHTRPL